MGHLALGPGRARAAAWQAALLLLLGACATSGALAQNNGAQNNGAQNDGTKTGAAARLVPAFPNLRFSKPVALLQAPGDPTRWYVVEQTGRVMVFDDDPAVGETRVFIDLRKRVNARGFEAGLLGMAFHPDYQANGQVILSYTRGRRNLTSVISRFFADDARQVLDPASERVVLTVDQPFRNHNGGQVTFGPDGFLYIGFGDGGAGGDPRGNGQNTDTLLGAMLRIDVDRGDPYGIPPDNPFAAGGGRPEIYAWGLRNPWRWSFDAATGDLWVGDVGQNRIEEIDIVVKGGNYGWNVREGSEPFRGGRRPGAGLIAPVAEYNHDFGCSVTGGYVYRGAEIPALVGTYVFGDFCSGRFWGLAPDGGGGHTMAPLFEESINLSSFGEAHDGRLFAVDLKGALFQIVAAE
ncbi:MAG: PQQ-dependent sugar dehydrogenase [Proteobacteria bacterium]|nr:PQQ-dependent sugar dehydrogenase [Pseudomonadota bacterium]